MQAVIHWAPYQQISSPLRGSKEMLILAFGWVLASVSIHLHAIPEGAPGFSRPSCECACIWINEHEQDCHGSCYGICVLQSGLAKLTWPLHPAVSSDLASRRQPPPPKAGKLLLWAIWFSATCTAFSLTALASLHKHPPILASVHTGGGCPLVLWCGAEDAGEPLIVFTTHGFGFVKHAL